MFVCIYIHLSNTYACACASRILTPQQRLHPVVINMHSSHQPLIVHGYALAYVPLRLFKCDQMQGEIWKVSDFDFDMI